MCDLPLGMADVITVVGHGSRRGDKWWADRVASAEVAVVREACGVFGQREWEWMVTEELVCAWIAKDEFV